MTLVVDASVAVKFLVTEPGSDAAVGILTAPEPLIAPDWLLFEVASALWKKVEHLVLLEADAREALESLPRFFSRLAPASTLLGATVDLSFRLQHPVYDCLYLAQAIEEDASVITADHGFLRAAERGGYADRVQLLRTRA